MIKKLLTTLVLLAILVGLGVLGYQAVLNHQINLNHWFVGGLTRGVDLSSYQGEVEMTTLASQNVSFAYIKATEGASYVDPQFEANWAAAEAAGLPAGAYHYFSYKVSGAEQARHYIETVGALGAGRLIPVVDMELTKAEKANPPEPAEVAKALRVFLATLEEEYGVRPMIYATRDYYDKYLKEDFADYPRWVRSVLWPVYIEAGGDWVLWQYDDHGKLEGYHGDEEFIDLNVLNGEVGLEAILVK